MFLVVDRTILDADIIWRAACLLIKQHGDDAEIVAARRADQLSERGERRLALVWIRIVRAIGELQSPPVGKPN